jgi:predicted nuclease with TOPRIM domain
MIEILRVLNEEIIRLKDEIAQYKDSNKSLFKSSERLYEENRMLRNDLKELSQMYQELKTQFVLGDASRVRAVLSPFVGNNFDPQMLNNNNPDYRRVDTIIT